MNNYVILAIILAAIAGWSFYKLVLLPWRLRFIDARRARLCDNDFLDVLALALFDNDFSAQMLLCGEYFKSEQANWTTNTRALAQRLGKTDELANARNYGRDTDNFMGHYSNAETALEHWRFSKTTGKLRKEIPDAISFAEEWAALRPNNRSRLAREYTYDHAAAVTDLQSRINTRCEELAQLVNQDAKAFEELRWLTMNWQPESAGLNLVEGLNPIQRIPNWDDLACKYLHTLVPADLDDMPNLSTVDWLDLLTSGGDAIANRDLTLAIKVMVIHEVKCNGDEDIPIENSILIRDLAILVGELRKGFEYGQPPKIRSDDSTTYHARFYVTPATAVLPGPEDTP